MPGGKIAVYTGILEVTKNKHGLAAVMGHEIAHAVAKHSVERASRSMAVNLGTQIADIISGGKISGASRTVGVDVAGMLAHFGIMNPFLSPKALQVSPNISALLQYVVTWLVGHG